MGSSYRLIRDEVLDSLPPAPRVGERSEGLVERVRAATGVMLQRRLRSGDLDPLVPWAIANFDTTGGDEFIRPLSDALVDRGRLRDVRRLWLGIIANRRRAAGKLRPDGDPSLSDYEQNARESAIRGMAEFASALHRLDQTEEAERVKTDIGLFRAGRRRRKPRRFPDRRAMDEAVFWEIVAETAGGEPGRTVHVDRLVERLERFSVRPIRAFQKILIEKLEAANHHDLRAVAFLARDGCGDDGFAYFRAWLVLQGREPFERALVDPVSAAGLVGDADPQCEPLLYAAEVAHENVNDAPLPEIARPKSKLRGEPWSEADLPLRFPELWKRFGGDPA